MAQTTIQLCIEEESQLYNHLDPAGERINDEVYSYLKSFCVDRINTVPYFDKIQIISDVPVDGGRFQENLHKAVKRDQDALDWQLKTNNTRAVWEYLVGIGMSIVGFLASYYLDKILLATVSFFGTMILREAVVIGTKLNPDIKHLKKRLDPLMKCKVEVIMNTGNQCGG